MRIEVVEATERPEELACRAARNDYMTEWIGDKSFEEVMESVDGDGLEEKKENLITHLIRRGHYGPFEHPHITFAIEGVSRITMAQITRHRHASFDVQSLRYTEPELGVTEDPAVRALPPGNGKKRRPGGLDVNQERTVAEWYREGVPIHVLSKVLERTKEGVEEILSSEGCEIQTKSLDQVNTDSWSPQVLGYTYGGLKDGVIVEDAVERDYLRRVSDSTGGNLYSMEKGRVKLAWNGSGLVEAIEQRIGGISNSGDRNDKTALMRGLFEASGGFHGDAYLTGREEVAELYSELSNELLEKNNVVEELPGGRYGVVMDSEALADYLYLDVGDFTTMHKSRLLEAMNASVAVEEKFQENVEKWLDKQAFIYPPSVREEAVVSRETGRKEFESPPWKRINQLREAYELQSESYNRLRREDVPAEDARAVLGMGIKINMTFTMNARALMHLFDMRAAGDAQWEIRRLSEMLIERLKEWMPTTFTFYDEHLKNRKNRLGP